MQTATPWVVGLNRPRWELGIMQGRLLPPVGERIQGFPGARWAEEFALARTLGLSHIEWILELPLESNPIWSVAGIRQIAEVIATSGVRVRWMCADVFMQCPFVGVSRAALATSRSVLFRAIEQAAAIGMTGIEIPCVDASAIKTETESEELVSALEPCVARAADCGIILALETSLAPRRVRTLLQRFNETAVRANYDTGNSASLGYEPTEEFDAYGTWIVNVHLKDRLLHGHTVRLGSGAVDFPKVFALLARRGYAGDFVLQAARDGDATSLIRNYCALVAKWMADATVETLV